MYSIAFFFSSRRRHTRCALVTGVQTCALPISLFEEYGPRGIKKRLAPHLHTIPGWRVAHVRYSQQHLTASSGDHHRREGQWQRSLPGAIMASMTKDRLGRATMLGRQCRRGLGPSRVHPWRSEEHTSELQSLVRISYAVFCLKKKNRSHNRQQTRPKI